VSMALMGGVEEVNEMLYSVLDRVGALAHSADGMEEAARPFDTRRNGFLLGEGGAILVAGAGTRRPYGFLSGFGMARVRDASISDWGSDETGVVTAMKAAIDDAELTPGAIDAVYASANGSRRGDALEERALRALFGSRIPPVVATKGLFGEYAAGGALHLAAALIALHDQRVHASPGYEGDGLPVTTATREAALQHVLVNTVSAGGGVVCAVVSRDAA
jgi:3-oxoacyl-[acyl-carrier-protein] synthase II